jgi:hypothetical protein
MSNLNAILSTRLYTTKNLNMTINWMDYLCE